MNLYEIIVQSANAALSLQNLEDGSMPPGHNGSYHDPETPVRNTAHWLITFLKAYSISGETKFLKAAKKAVTYLCSDAARPMRAAFWHRRNPEKDTCNGLIGQAWTIEALVIAARDLERPDLTALAEQVFLLHPQEQPYGVWRRVNADGSYLGVDSTFNHQLWFAASGGLLTSSSQCKTVDARVRQFLGQLTRLFEVRSSGLIKHIMPPIGPVTMRRQLKNVLERAQKIKHGKMISSNERYRQQKEVGYHSFNLYAFALLKQAYPDHSFWENQKFLSALKYVTTELYAREVETSKYGYQYNPPGFEVPFVLEVLCPGAQNSTQQMDWVSKQLQSCYNFESSLMDKNASDATTHAARMYESTRLPNLPLKLNLSL